MKTSNFFERIIRLFDAFSPKVLVIFRISIFRLMGKFFLSQSVSSNNIFNFGEKDKHIFFGYYDITPFSNDDKIILAMRAPLIDRAPKIQDYAEVGYYDINNPESNFISLGKTNAWCWQQGCRLQWHGERENKIIYNNIIDGEYGAIIQEFPSGNIVKKIKRSLYALSKDGKWGLSLNFSRLQRLRPGYGYGSLSDKSIGNLCPDDNSIELANLETNEVRQLFSLEEISKIEPHNSMLGAEHYFNHLMFNLSGNKFLFFHLWMDRNGKRYSRLFVANREGDNIKLINNSGSVSHYNWISEDEIILYSLIKEKNEYTYAIFDSRNGEIKYFGKNIPSADGHPTLLKNGEIIITDTYPDLCSQRNLLSYNIKEDKTKVLVRFDSSSDLTGEFRCDLHPRISNNQKMICVDRIIDGRRNISIVPLDAELL